MSSHHFTMSRKADKKRSPRDNLDIQVTTIRNGRVTQAYVNEIAAHVERCEQPEPKKAMRDVSNRVDHRYGRAL